MGSTVRSISGPNRSLSDHTDPQVERRSHGSVGGMASIGTTSIDRRGAVLWPAAIFGVVALLGTIGRAAGLDDVPQIETFVLVFASIVIEALPFILLGAAVSAFIEVFISDALVARVVRLPLALQLPGAALGGFAFPVCECGSIP
jgi:uncharacterized membrane protein YraQ (UPF0718 family)